MTASAELAERLAELTTHTLEALQREVVAEWRIPRVYAGHEVGADVRADLIFTLGHLADAGVETVAGLAPDALITQLLAGVRGRATHTFFSYRIAETLLRRGPFNANPLLLDLDEAQRAQVALACDSSDWVELFDAGVLPRNYAAVLSRCEVARTRLGLLDDPARVDGLVDRLRAVLGTNPLHALDDSNDGVGRYDIYTGDVWLFCETLAPMLGDLWREGMRAALRLVDTVAGPDGAAIPWGRSTGVLAAALTVELAALAATTELVPQRRAAWVRRGCDALRAVERSFDPDGVVNAHRHRNQDAYRGPARRLQLTVDVLGKLAWAAATLRHAPGIAAATARETYQPVDTMVPFERTRQAGVWAHRSAGTRFVVPFVGTTRSHYLPALHAPGTFETPVDADLPCWSPLVVRGLARFTAGGLPLRLEHAPGEVRAEWEGFPRSGTGLDEDSGEPLAGTRRMRLRVERRTVVLDDEVEFDRAPDALAWAIPETEARPLHVEMTADVPHSVDRITVGGIAEWSSPYSAIERVHQLDVDPATRVRATIRVTPVLRVGSTAHGHHYDRSLYEPMGDRVLGLGPPLGVLKDPAVSLDDVDLLHLHWPEWFGFDDLAEHERLVVELRDHSVPVVWTAHNLTPHDRRPDVYDPIYARWAQAVDAVIHHSAWGEARFRDRYRFRSECRHEVIPHGHFGGLWGATNEMTRAEAEARLGLAPTGLRIGMVGAPRADKHTQAALDGFAACTRDDLQLACWSLGFTERVPDDPRIVVATRYREVDPVTYATRLRACDLLVLPFDPHGDMLGTGTAHDALGLGIPALVSDWGYLTEVMGDAGIPCGHTAASIRASLKGLTRAQVDAAAAACRARKARFDWAPIARRTADLFDRVVLDEP